MRLSRFSPKQRRVLLWWSRRGPCRERDAIICDGAVRSGKTLCLSLSFVMWGQTRHPGGTLAICGKTVASLHRNLVEPLCAALAESGVTYRLTRSQNLLEVGAGKRALRIYLFGGRDESSAAHIQGITLAGVLLDEVALMPRSFVEQALARCSVEGSKFWFSCNPGHPRHWFYREWVSRARRKNALYIHFTMDDNPTLSAAVRERYKRLYSGVFYERFVLGRWVAAQGAVYPMFGPANLFDTPPRPAPVRYAVSCDYGTVNPCSMGLWGESGGVWYRLREYYHDSRAAGVQKTDEDYAGALRALCGDIRPELVLVDPSAASFIACLRRRGYPAVPARNDVLGGIRLVAGALAARKIRIHRSCRAALREFSLYRWHEEARGDAPVKENDHAMDDIRYFALRYLGGGESGFCAAAVRRK